MNWFTLKNIIETVVLLGREKVDGYIDIDLDISKIEGRTGTATYPQIKDYIMEKYGLKVSSLYIGQIKDKVGIKERIRFSFVFMKRSSKSLSILPIHSAMECRLI